MRVNVGDVVQLDYRDYDDTLQSNNMFVVVYHECDDYIGSDNFTAIKISTNSRSFQVPLLKTNCSFLEHDSYVNCSHPASFRETQVKKIISTLSPYYMNKINQQMGNWLDRGKYQLVKRYGEENVFDINKPTKY